MKKHTRPRGTRAAQPHASSKEALDRLRHRYAERLRSLIAERYRQQREQGDSSDALRQLLDKTAQQVVSLQRSLQELYDALFINSCDEWTVPQIGEYVVTQVVSALNERRHRIRIPKRRMNRGRAQCELLVG
jgi:hypothetical protein